MKLVMSLVLNLILFESSDKFIDQFIVFIDVCEHSDVSVDLGTCQTYMTELFAKVVSQEQERPKYTSL